MRTVIFTSGLIIAGAINPDQDISTQAGLLVMFIFVASVAMDLVDFFRSAK